jgi:queuine tRNA-ribosyltransferase catalytic subunit
MMTSLTMHNVQYQLSLMGSIREAILEDRYPAFIRKFFEDYYGSRQKAPEWAVDALKRVNVDLLAE